MMGARRVVFCSGFCIRFASREGKEPKGDAL
jgi:hypothetical protein